MLLPVSLPAIAPSMVESVEQVEGLSCMSLGAQNKATGIVDRTPNLGAFRLSASPTQLRVRLLPVTTYKESI